MVSPQKRSTYMRTCRRRLPSWPSIPAARCCAAAAFAAAVDEARFGAARFAAALGPAASALLPGTGALPSLSSSTLPAAAFDAFFLAGFFACASSPAAFLGIVCTAGTYAVVCTATEAAASLETEKWCQVTLETLLYYGTWSFLLGGGETERLHHIKAPILVLRLSVL